MKKFYGYLEGFAFGCIVFVLILTMWQSASGQIIVPAENDRDRPIVVTVKAPMPEGAVFSGGWRIEGDAKFLKAPAANTIHVWAGPGNHSITFVGYWVHTETVTFKDGDGNTISINSFLGSGSVNEEAEFTVKGAVKPDPKPEPPGPTPTPGGPYQLMFFYDGDQLDDLPPAQRQLLTSLVVRQKLESAGHNLVEILEKNAVDAAVVAKYKPWINAVKGDPLPRVAIAEKEGGKVADFQLPSSLEALEGLLKDPALSGFFEVSRRGKQ